MSRSNPTEASISRRLVAAIKARGHFACKVPGTAFLAGMPDVHAVVRGRAVWLEGKKPGEPLRPIQAATIAELAAAGAVTGVYHSVAEGLEFIAAAEASSAGSAAEGLAIKARAVRAAKAGAA